MSAKQINVGWTFMLVMVLSVVLAQSVMAFDVSGTVDDGAITVDGATVTLTNIVGPTVVGTTSTAGGGLYSFTGIVDGTYDLSVTSDAYEDAVIGGLVVSGGNVVQDVTLTLDTTAPTITIGPTVSGLTETAATINWTTDEASSSVVNYGTSPGVLTSMASSVGDVTVHSVALSGLSANTTYYYEVVSTDPATNPVTSTETSFITAMAVAGPPKQLIYPVTATWGYPGDSSYVGWNASSTPGVSYELQADDGGGFVTVYSGPATGVNFPTTAGTTYVFQVRAIGGGYLPSAWVGPPAGNSMTVTGACVIPNNFNVTTWTPSSDLPLYWSASMTPGVTYELQTAVDGGSFGADIYAGTATTHTATGLVSGSSYVFRVRATYPGFTSSAWRMSGETVAEFEAGIPGAFNVNSWVSTDSLDLSWGPSATAGVTYHLQQSDDGGTSWADVAPGPGTSTSTTVSGLVNGSTYTHRVRATLAGYAPSAWRTSGETTVELMTGIPGTFNVNSWTSNDSLDLSWGASATAGVTYQLQQSDDGGASWADVVPGPGTETSATATGLVTGMTYSYRVRATLAGYADSAWRDASSDVVVMLKCRPPGKPKAPKQINDATFQVSWRASRPAADSYELQIDEGSGWGASIPLAGTSYVYTAPAAGDYQFRVRSIRAGFAPSAWVGPATTSVTVTVSYAGIENCVYCHSKYGQQSDWNKSGHSNQNNSPSDTYFGNPASNCAPCHDAQGDGAAMANVDGTARPVVGCEACHGPSNTHRANRPVNTPVPLTDVCNGCHNTPGHPGDTGDTVLASRHNSTIGSSAKCQRCHSYEGSLVFAAYTGDQNVMNQMDTDSVPALGSVTPPLCNACHDAHTSSMRTVKSWDPNNNGDADQFDLCTSCHTFINPNGTLVASGSGASGTDPFYHNTAWYRIIATTHYDDPATSVENANALIEGYVVRRNDDNPCFDCHGHELITDTRPSRGTTTTHRDWAQSGHAGQLLEAKLAADIGAGDEAEVDAIMAAGIDDTTGAAWNHYNWDDAGRASCQQCHTSTGAMNYLDDPAAYDPANNDFSHLTAGQNEMLYCWGCHSDTGAGSLRNPGPITVDYSDAPFTYPDASGSNVCLACHTGRESGDSVKNSTQDFTNGRFINSHYLTAGGTVYTVTGYEYGGLDYTNLPDYLHDTIGLTAANTGNNGPCVGCHMSSPTPHIFQPIERDVTDAITAITSSICTECHTGGFALSPLLLNTLEGQLKDSLSALEAQMAAAGHPYLGGYPYFAQSDWTNGGTYDGMDLMGAAFNFNLLAHDPGAYAHNRTYAKRLIFDAIDYADDATLNASVEAAIDALVGAGIDATQAANAKTYLDGNSGTGGVQRP